MQQFIPHTVSGNNFLLSSDRCIYWQEEKTLVLSDLHLGKTGHFRKEGIAVPQAILKDDLQCFVTLIQQFRPEKILIIGDMFHLHVSDHGRGMSAEQINRIGPHMQFDRKTFEQQGAGLGIVIAKSLTELLGGQFAIVSRAGQETTVKISFRLAGN